MISDTLDRFADRLRLKAIALETESRGFSVHYKNFVAYAFKALAEVVSEVAADERDRAAPPMSR